MSSPPLQRTNSHSRTDSNSFRIPINLSSPNLSNPSSPRSQNTYQSDRYEEDTWIDSTKSWLGGRVGRGNAVLTRPWLRRWMLFVLVLIIFIVAFNGKDDVSSRLSNSWAEKGEEFDVNSVPRVDRSTLEKLRLLELHYGKDEDWEEEDTMLNPQYGGGARKDDSPPTVAGIPDFIKPDPLSPNIRLPKVPSDLLDSEFCPEQNGKACAYLVAGFIGEQETKAQLHLHQLGLLALALNRTLVLPNVAKSRMGSCYTSPFTFYYSSTSLSSLGIPTISHENFLEWNERRESPPSAQIVSLPGTNLSYPLGAVEIDSIADPTLVPRKPTRKLCLKAPRTRLDFSSYSPIAIFAPEGYHKSERNGLNRFGDSVIHILRSEKVGSQASRMEGVKQYSIPNVLVINWELRFPILSPSLLLSPELSLQLYKTPLPFSHFTYAETWSNISLQIANSLSPFIAIHWRTETLLASNLVPCAFSLVKKIEFLYSQYPLFQTIYLATDYPLQEIFPPPSKSGSSSLNLPPTIAHSGTFAKVITPQHHLAFQTFLIEFDKLRIQLNNKLKLTTFDLEIQKLNLDESIRSQLIPSSSSPTTPTISNSNTINSITSLDSGVIGIIDKGVAINAEIFLTGLTIGSNSCGKVSSFTRQIVSTRDAISKKLESNVEVVAGEEEQEEEEEMEGDAIDGEKKLKDKQKLWNIVNYWSSNGKGEQ